MEPGSYSRNMHNSISEFCRTWAPTQVEDGNFRLSTRFLEHRPIISPPTDQNKVTSSASATFKIHPKFCLLFWAPLGLLCMPTPTCAKLLQLCLTLCNPMDCSRLGSFVHGIFQAKIPQWFAIPSSRGSLPPRDRTWVSHIAG